MRWFVFLLFFSISVESSKSCEDAFNSLEATWKESQKTPKNPLLLNKKKASNKTSLIGNSKFMKFAEKKDFVHEKFGDKREDPYYWLKERDSPEVLNYLEAENNYAKENLKNIEDLKEKIFKEIKNYIPRQYDTYPYKDKDYMYWKSYETGKEHYIFKRKHIKTQKEEVLLDVNKLAKNKKHYDLSGSGRSPDQKILAYSVDEQGNEAYDIYFKNLKTGKEIGRPLKQVTDMFEWANDNKTLFYIEMDDKFRSHQVFRYDIYTGKKELIYEEKDKTFSLGLHKTLLGSHFVIDSSGRETNEQYIIPANSPYEKPRLILTRKEKHRYYVIPDGNNLYILTNYQDAKNFKLMKAHLNDSSQSLWEDVIPYDKDTFIEDFQVFKDVIVLEVRHKGYIEIRLLDKKDNSIHKVSFPDPICFCWLASSVEYDTKSIRLGMNSFIRPTAIYEYDYKNKVLNFKWQVPIGGNFSTKDYVLKTDVAIGRDGTEIPISFFHKKDLKINKDTPVYLDGYGAYGGSLDPYFALDLLPLVNRGFIYAMAHIRGGADKGIQWHEDGKLLKKKNTFYDFIDVAKHFINKSYTSPSHLYISGASAGGLLIGAVLNEASDLFNGAIVSVPFVDAITTMLDDSIPLTTTDYEEWGNPNEKKYYDYIKSYSPYDNVKKTRYPHILISSGYHDPRVQYWEPAKWVARLREYKTDNNQLFLITEMDSGHFGNTGRFEEYKLYALQNAFLLGLEEQK